MVEPKPYHATVPYFNIDARGKSYGSLEDSSPKGEDIIGKSTVQIIRSSSSIIIMKYKRHPRSTCIMEKSPPPFG